MTPRHRQGPLLALWLALAAASSASAEALFPIEMADPEPAASDTSAAPPDSTEPGAPRVIVYERAPSDPSYRDELEDRLYLEESELQYWLEDRQGRTLTLGVEAGYDRVHELAISATQQVEHRKRLVPRLRLREMFSTGLEHWYYIADLEQPLSRPHRLVLGVRAFNETAVFADLTDRIGDAENTLASLFFREDFRHYYGREGIELYASGGISRRPELTLRYTDAEENALPATTNGSVFRPRDSFRDNPRATEGRLRAIGATLRYDSAHERRSKGLIHGHALSYDWSSDELRSDFDFSRWVVESRVEVPLGPLQEFRARGRAGGIVTGELPVQSRYYLGGIGTLHAQEYAALIGERMLLLNLEYHFDVFWQVRGIVFQDVGAAWARPTRLSDVRPAFDAGLALSNRTGRFRVNVARDLRAEHAPLVVTVRLKRPF